jgi:transcription antitermination factor NusG
LVFKSDSKGYTPVVNKNNLVTKKSAEYSLSGFLFVFINMKRKLKMLVKEVYEVFLRDTPIQLSEEEENLIRIAVQKFYKKKLLPFKNVENLNVGSVMVALNSLKSEEGDILKNKVFKAFTSPLAKKLGFDEKTGKVIIKPSSFN